MYAVYLRVNLCLTLKRLHMLARLAWLGIAMCGLICVVLVLLSFLFFGGLRNIQRLAERAKERVTVGRTMARLASAGAALRRNMVVCEVEKSRANAS